jgi:trigger factor
LLGVKAGESRTVEVAFPREGPHEDVAGKTIKFWVKVSAVKEKRLPELNDDFAKELGKFDRLEDVEKEIRTSLEREAELDAERRAREVLVDELIRQNPLDVPESMVNNLLEAITADAEKQWRSSEPFDSEKARVALKPVALRQAKRFVVLREVAKKESLSVSPEDIDQRIRVLAFRTQQSPVEVRRKIDSDGSMDQLAEDLLEEKILALLMESAEVETVERKDEGRAGEETKA